MRFTVTVVFVTVVCLIQLFIETTALHKRVGLLEQRPLCSDRPCAVVAPILHQGIDYSEIVWTHQGIDYSEIVWALSSPTSTIVDLIPDDQLPHLIFP